MKTNWIFAALFLLLTTASMAQPGRRPTPDWGNDYREDVFRIERLDRIVNLNGGQKRELFRIEQFYDREFALAPRYPDTYRQLMWRKSQDVLAVLSPRQRDRLFSFEQYRMYGGNQYNNGNGYNNGYGNRGNGQPGWGRRW
ncbi:hypothetical protein ACAW74_14540 [Fibrella sp. WM1]|uniref:hypothetical protein n=1 Tax=Fibrella musci TaxID=3242485 RepID=UPI0035213B6F